MSRKILISPGYGAGWSTWITGVPTKFSCEYTPIIEALEKGEELTEQSPSVQQFIKDCKEKYDTDPYLGGLYDLCIREIDDDEQYIVEVYDGSESLRLRNNTEWN